MGGGKLFDPDGMREVANRLEEAADEADSAGESMPAAVDAGPFTPSIVSMVHAVAAEDANLIMRLGMAAEKIRVSAARHEHNEEQNLKTMEDVLRDLAGD